MPFLLASNEKSQNFWRDHEKLIKVWHFKAQWLPLKCACRFFNRAIIMDSSQFYCRVLSYFNLCWLLLGGFSSYTDTQPHAYIHISKHIPIYGYRVTANICIWCWYTERGIHSCIITTEYWNSEGKVWSVTFGAFVFIQVPRCLLRMNKGPSPHAGHVKRNMWSFFMYKRSQESLKVVFLL